MRRFAILGAVVLGSTVLAAMGLAQSGFRGQREASSLVDRLTALRQSLANESHAGAEPSPAAGQRGDPRERSVLSAPGSRVGPPRGAQPSPAESATEPQSEDRPKRPRLLAHLDPFHLLSNPDTAQDPPARPIESAERPAQPFWGSQDLRRRATPRYTTRPPMAAATEPPIERPQTARRSPLLHRPVENLPGSASAGGTTGVALGPAGSQSVANPAPGELGYQGPARLARPAADSDSTTGAQPTQPIGAQSPNVTPIEESPESSTGDRWSESGPRHANAPREDADAEPSQSGGRPPFATPIAREPLVPEAERNFDSIAGNETPTVPTEASRTDASAPGLTDQSANDDALDARSYRTDSARASSPTHAQSLPGDYADNGARGSDYPTPRETAAAAVRGDDVLSSDEAPAVAWEVTGPRKIVIGRSATFEIRLRNEGEDDARRMIARIDVPASAEIVSAESTHGVSQRIEDGASSAVLEWRIDQLPSARQAVLQLTVVPRTNQMMSLQVSVRSEPRAAVARVEVLEPKLRLALDGPADLLHGEPQTYRLTVSNPGTGSAENVVVLFTPPGMEDRSAERHVVGLLNAGESKTIDLEIAPQQAGDLTMKAVAAADGDLRDLAERRVLVRKPELVVDARGPKTTYAGTVATYYFRVQNSGNATAEDVTLQTHLPLGAEFVRAIDDRKTRPEADKETVTWRIGSVPPGEEIYMELKCIVNWAGENTMELAALASGGEVQQSKSITTHVVALADLKLEVSDPQGPVAVGREAVYEVRVKNRGSNTAEQINVAALFSEGIDPVGVEGGQHSIENGRVGFRTIESLPAGREIVFKIRAVAKQPGTHVFRAEVLCRELETKLATEETTRFYIDEATVVRAKEGMQAAMHGDLFEVE